VASARQLLELGADLAAGVGWGGSPFALLGGQGNAGLEIAGLLLARGADVLYDGSSLALAGIAEDDWDLADLLLAHLQRQRQAPGGLDLDDMSTVLDVFEAAAMRCHVPLARLCLHELELHGCYGGYDSDDPTDEQRAERAETLQHLLTAAATGGSPAVLRMLLLDSWLPFAAQVAGGPAEWRGELLRLAAATEDVEEAVPLLHQAGAPLTATAVLEAAGLHEVGWANAVICLLECGRPEMPTAQPEAPGLGGYSCPIHRALFDLVSCCQQLPPAQLLLTAACPAAACARGCCLASCCQSFLCQFSTHCADALCCPHRIPI
jgi:hypothetical protein